MDSILNSVKVALGIDKSCKDFDTILIPYINTVLAILTQLGIGKDPGFQIEDAGDEWSDFLPEEPKYNQVKSFVTQKVRYMFDPPTSGSAMGALEAIIAELEWRVNEIAESSEVNQNA